MTSKRFQILVCDGPSCGVTHESERIVDCLQRALAERPDLKDRVNVANYTCYGRCDEGPNVFVQELAEGEAADGYPDPDVFDEQRGFYPGVNDEATATRLLDEHCATGTPIEGFVEDY